jgi:hypothetical protein
VGRNTGDSRETYIRKIRIAVEFSADFRVIFLLEILISHSKV